ncbi:Carboxylesterase family-domain-containing protein [Elsinoe ampelina]|uniref:Carboxylesterase family-domain-containing protein n=1 Tax=Elsinoe ampelina TaxID=302913 RepID=A0A6A6GQB6_9PEZI|nr:Carboxylesterase family-domain-containing protein [Elsinoe ampelina]
MLYIHSGGLQYSAAPNNDFSHWVGQSQDFIAVNVGYRVGALGLMAHPSLPSANAGLLDQRLALQWIPQPLALITTAPPTPSTTSNTRPTTPTSKTPPQ